MLGCFTSMMPFCQHIRLPNTAASNPKGITGNMFVAAINTPEIQHKILLSSWLLQATKSNMNTKKAGLTPVTVETSLEGKYHPNNNPDKSTRDFANVLSISAKRKPNKIPDIVGNQNQEEKT